MNSFSQVLHRMLRSISAFISGCVNAALGMITIFALTAGVAHALAADFVVLDKTVQSPLSFSTNADVVRTLNVLKKHAEKNGTARIIVGLRTTFTPEGGLTAAAAAQQRDEIARLQYEVLEKLPSLKQRPERARRFESIPFMALEVNAVELEALASLTEIVSIKEDQLAAPTIRTETVTPENK